MGSIKMRKQEKEEEDIGLRIQEVPRWCLKDGGFPVGYLHKKAELARYAVYILSVRRSFTLRAESSG